MKLKGAKLEPPKPIDVVFERGNDYIRFKVQPIFDFEEFDKVCPFPEPPMITRPGKAPEPNPKNPEHLKAREDYFRRRRGWTYLKALEPTPDLEWETMSLTDPQSWSHANFVTELKSAGFTQMEIGHLINKIDRANTMDDRHMEEIRALFVQREVEVEAETAKQSVPSK